MMIIVLVSFVLIHLISINNFITPAFATDTLQDSSTDQIWLLHADKEYYSNNETVVIRGHVPLDKLVSGEHVTIEIFTPDGNRYIKARMNETVANSGYYNYYFSLPPGAPNLAGNETLLGEWTMTSIYDSIEDHASFFLETESQQERKADVPTWQLLEKCKELGIKSGNCSESEILKGECLGPSCNVESQPPILFDAVIVSLLIGAGVVVVVAWFLIWEKKIKQANEVTNGS